METTDVHPDNAHANPELRDGLYRLDHPDSDLFLPGPVRATSLERMDDHGRLMREIADQSNKRREPGEPDQPGQSIESGQPGKPDHRCPCHPERTCDCDDDGDECRGDADGQPGDEWVAPYIERARSYYENIDHQRNAKYVGKPFPVLAVPRIGTFECPTNGKACGSQYCERGRCEESVARAKAGADWSHAQTANDH